MAKSQSEKVPKALQAKFEEIIPLLSVWVSYNEEKRLEARLFQIKGDNQNLC